MCDTNEVNNFTDKDKDDKIAEVTVSYLVREGSNVYRDNQEHVLRMDANGKWKLVVSRQIEGENSDDD